MHVRIIVDDQHKKNYAFVAFCLLSRSLNKNARIGVGGQNIKNEHG